MAARTHNSPSWHCMCVASNPSASGSSLHSPGQKYWMFKPTGLLHSRDIWCVHVVCSRRVLLWGYGHFPVVLRGKNLLLFYMLFFSPFVSKWHKGKVMWQQEEWCFKAWRWGWMLCVLECKWVWGKHAEQERGNVEEAKHHLSDLWLIGSCINWL